MFLSRLIYHPYGTTLLIAIWSVYWLNISTHVGADIIDRVDHIIGRPKQLITGSWVYQQ